MKRIVLVFAVVTVMTVFALPSPSHAAVTQHQSSGVGQDSFLVYGDSLTWESANFIQQRMGNEVFVHSFPASAPCQWVTWLNQDLATYHPKVVGIISAGNPLPWTDHRKPRLLFSIRGRSQHDVCHGHGCGSEGGLLRCPSDARSRPQHCFVRNSCHGTSLGSQLPSRDDLDRRCDCALI